MDGNKAKLTELAHRPAHKKSAGGPAVRWTEAQVLDELREPFFREIEKNAPDVLIDLKNSVWSGYRDAAPLVSDSVDQHVGRFPVSAWPQPLRASFVKWARKHNLLDRGRAPHWVASQVEYTLGVWTTRPRLSEIEPLQWCGYGGYSGMQPAQYFAVRMRAQRIERDIHESDEHFEERVFAKLERIVRPQREREFDVRSPLRLRLLSFRVEQEAAGVVSAAHRTSRAGQVSLRAEKRLG